MSTFKCKMCGGALEITGNESVATCEYCGTKQTLPKLDDERRANMYDRANHFRRNNEFDKAMGIYEQILNEDASDAEAYWSLVLCRYGIEYVEDPGTHRRIPTVNRAQYTSVFDDDNYKSALKYADAYQRAVYEEEAKTINEIQKGILEISQKEEPFDVFICYKETDADGRRTHDSVLANDLYHQLTREGFKVFFSRITLEDKLGTAYEPYIFAALNSAKVMVVLGTKPEYFNAVWVKNEWARYLSLIKNGANKILIPAYRDMDPYDLPEEFSHLQAQDMSKLGFMQDLIRGIKKIAQADESKAPAPKETVVTGTNASTAPLLKRAFMFLEDGDWQSANEYCEKVLDIDPECAEAYLGKLLAELRVRNRELLKNQKEPFNSSNNYKKIMRFGDEKLKEELQDYLDFIENRNRQNAYNDAVHAMESATTAKEYIKAAERFDSLFGYFDSKKLAEECRNRERKIIEAQLEDVKKKASDRESVVAFINNAKQQLKEQEAVYEANKSKLFGEGAKRKKSALGEIKRLKKVIAESESKEKFECGSIKFGLYYNMKGSFSKGEIEWLVLEIKNGKVLLLSKYALDCKPYNTSNTSVTWETCSLRKWLNNDFINEAFTDDERNFISTVKVSADKKPGYDTNPGNATQDKVFLLSITEAEKYFSSDEERKCIPTEYAVAQGVSTYSNYTKDGKPTCWWWLRSPGDGQDYAAGVGSGGGVDGSGDGVGDSDSAVRPALWIDLNS